MKLLQSEVFPILFLLSKWIAMSYQRPILRRAHSFSYKGVLLLDPLSWWCSVGILENWAKELKLKELFFKPQVKCGFSDYWKFVKTMVVSTEFRRKKKKCGSNGNSFPFTVLFKLLSSRLCRLWYKTPEYLCHQFGTVQLPSLSS